MPHEPLALPLVREEARRWTRAVPEVLRLATDLRGAGMSALPEFPVDDATLLAVEHALGYCLTFEGEDGGPLDEPRGIGADYSLDRLLDFMSGTIDDPDGVVQLIAGDPEKAELDEALGLNGGPLGTGPNTPIYLDERPHYRERDIIRALIAEVRRLRDGGAA